MPKIMYVLCGKYNKYEAVTKDVFFLMKNFNSDLIFLVKDFKNKVISKIYEVYSNLKLLSYLLIFKNRYDIMHVFCSLNDKTHINMLSLLKGEKKIILNSFSNVDKSKKKYIDKLKKFDKIIVECNIDKERLLKQGIKKVEVIYPSIEKKNIRNQQKEKKKINVLFASSPFERKHFQTRGINLMINAIKNYNVGKLAHFTFLWRLKYKKELLEKINGINNIEVIDKLIDNISPVYERVDAVIVPFVVEKDNKRCPRTVIEALAFGKPVLVSNKVGIADIIKKEKCGVVFAKSEKGLYDALINLKKNYKKYSKNTFKTLKKYFDGKINLEKYSKIYSNLIKG